MLFREESRGSVALLVARTTPLTIEESPAMKAQIAACFARGNLLQVIDLSDVDFIDSSALGALLTSLKLVKSGGDIGVCGLKGRVNAMFMLTRMDRVFPLFPESSATVKAPQRSFDNQGAPLL